MQEKFLHQGPQDNESAVEQAKDEQISDFIRNKCTCHIFPLPLDSMTWHYPSGYMIVWS